MIYATLKKWQILFACKKYGIKRGIFCLSSCIYPCNPSRFPMDESMIHESPPHPSNEGYAYAKERDGRTSYSANLIIIMYPTHLILLGLNQTG
mgnify:CR=1 FL=1